LVQFGELGRLEVGGNSIFENLGVGRATELRRNLLCYDGDRMRELGRRIGKEIQRRIQRHANREIGDPRNGDGEKQASPSDGEDGAPGKSKAMADSQATACQSGDWRSQERRRAGGTPALLKLWRLVLLAPLKLRWASFLVLVGSALRSSLCCAGLLRGACRRNSGWA
jgi:hypothetical protein